MTDRPISSPTHTARISMKVEPEFRDRVVKAAEAKDGGNVSRFLRRAAEDVIKREQLLQDERGVA